MKPRSPIPGHEVRHHSPATRPPKEVDVETALGAYLPRGKPLALKLTDNQHTMVAVRRAPSGYSVRLHHMFTLADERMLRAVARYVVHNDRRASGEIGAFIDRHRHRIRRGAPRSRRVLLRTQGKAHDLQRIYDQLNGVHFAGALSARITWGPAPRRTGPRQSIKMGSFAMKDRIIRIHPLLDDPSVPEYFVAWIVFHEMLHGKHAVRSRGGRRCFHPSAFREDERCFPDYARASAWERANIDRLLGR